MRPSTRRLAGLVLLAWLVPSVSRATTHTFTNFESHQVHPLALSDDGARLFAVNTPDNRLTVYQVTPGGLVIEAEVPVGLEPVSVRQRTATEVWVVNHLSDDISIVDLTTMNVRATLAVGDEPTDVVFAGTAGRAFVCVSQEDAVRIFDPGNLAAPATVIPIFGSDPRALDVSPAGDRVYVAVFESGNGTSILGADEVAAGGGPPSPNPPMNPALPAAPAVGLIVKWMGGGDWRDETGSMNWNAPPVSIPYTLPDQDVAELDANAAFPIPRYFAGVGTLNFNLNVNPVSGLIYVSNTEAFNLTRFEPNLNGRFAQNRVTLIDPAGAGTVTPVHLNGHINYAVMPGPPAEIEQSLSQPNGGDWDAAGQNLYLAAVGSGKLAVLDPSGAVTARVDVGEGPTAALVDDARERVYVLNRFTNSVALVSTVSLLKTGEVSLGYQPEPAAVTAGRKFLYDARLSSGHGDLACASCHAFGNFDNIAWDLGDPTGTLAPSPQIGIPPFHPMKGPMTTQSLRGLAATEPFHWRGDRADFTRFNPAFQFLMGRADSLTTPDMQAFTDFIMTIVYPPNPAQNLDRTWPDPAPPAGSPERGRIEFTSVVHDGGVDCQACHQSSPPGEPFRVSPGTNGLLIPGPALQESQAFKIPQLRNMYEKTGFEDAPGPQKRGFGFLHDGSIDNLFDFLLAPVFQFSGNQARRDVEAFMLAFDTGTAPAVGVQVTVDASNKNDAATIARIALLMARADVGDIDLVVKGRVSGDARGYLYAGGGNYETDGNAEPLVAEATLRAGAGAGAERTWTGVPPGNGLRIGVDRDGDTFRDFHEIEAGSNPADPASIPSASAVNEPGAGAGRGGAVLMQSSPNPLAGSSGTRISFSLADPADVTLRIFDPQGRLVRVLLENRRLQGTTTVEWNGFGDDGRPVASGIYFYRLEAGRSVKTRSLVVVR
jgi:YVTN family beta-propeller protein